MSQGLTTHVSERGFSRSDAERNVCHSAAAAAEEPAVLYAVLLIAVTALGACLRFHLLTSKSFWLDEGFSVTIARLPWGDFWQLLWRREANMAFYYLLLHFWMGLGRSEFFVRGLSAVFATATIPAVYALGTRLFRPAVGLVAALLLAVNAFDVRYAQEARSYSLLVLLAAVTTLLFVKAVENPTGRRWTLYTLFSALCVYTQFFGILVPLAHGLSLVALRREQIPEKQFLRSTRYLAYSLVPLAIFLVKMGPEDMRWLPLVTPSIAHEFFVFLAGNNGNTLLILAAVGAAIGAATGISLFVRRGRSLQTWRYALVLTWFVFPITATLVAGAFRPFYLDRYLILCLPAEVLLIALGICRLRYSAMRFAVLAIFVLLGVGGVQSYYRHDFDLRREDWRSATHYVLANARPRDAAFFYVGPGRLPFEYYRSLAGASMSAPEVVYPASGDHLTYHDFLVTPMAEVLPSLPERGDRMWLVLSSAPDMINDVMRAWYGKRYPYSREVNVGGVRIVLYSRIE